MNKKVLLSCCLAALFAFTGCKKLQTLMHGIRSGAASEASQQATPPPAAAPAPVAAPTPPPVAAINRSAAAIALFVIGRSAIHPGARLARPHFAIPMRRLGDLTLGVFVIHLVVLRYGGMRLYRMDVDSQKATAITKTVRRNLPAARRR